MECRIMSRRLAGACRRAARLYYSTHTHALPAPHSRYLLQHQSGIHVTRYKQTLASTNTKDDLQNSENSSEDEAIHRTNAHAKGSELPGSQETSGSHSTESDIIDGNVSVLNGMARTIKDATSDLNFQDGNRMTIFHKPSHNVINVDLNNDNNRQNEVTLFFRPTKEVINLTFHKNAQNRRPLTTDEVEFEPMDEHKTLDSVQDVQWKAIKVDTNKLLDEYMKLAKIRLTGLVVITSMAGYAMAPGAFHLSTFLLCTLGTGLQSASANAINQYFEVPYDSQMNRTKNRPIIRGAISPLHAVSFAFVTGSAGLGILTFGVNPLTAGLGMANLVLYTLIYTPMKRLSITNTWLGSFVGAVPPMMGWAACTGQLDPGAWLLAAIMYAWQFPHFNALSWNLRQDYSRAGYRMTSVVNPALCKRVAFRYCIVITGLCTLAPVIDLTTWMFAFDSFPVNAYCCYLGWRFYRDGDSNSSRKLFRFSLFHIPVLIVLMLLNKKTWGEGAKKAHSGIMESAPATNSGVVVNSPYGAKDSLSIANASSVSS